MMAKSDMPSESLLRRIEARTGRSIEQLKEETLWQKRVRLTRSEGKVMRFTRNFPLVGRGCVLGDRLVSSSEVNRRVDRLLSR